MIFGIGTDIVKISRIENLYNNYGDKVANKVLSKAEIEIFNKFTIHSRKMSYLSKRFAAKEAFVKALGTGFRDDITFTSISVYNNNLGRPELKLTPKIQARLPENSKFFVSLSDEVDLVMAFVVIEH